MSECCRTEIPEMLEVSDIAKEGKGQTSFFFRHHLDCKPGQFIMVWLPGFDEKLKRFQDWDLWLTMAEAGHHGVWLNQFLYKVNTGGAQTMSHWLPSSAYKFLPFLPAVKRYNLAKAIIIKKHNL